MLRRAVVSLLALCLISPLGAQEVNSDSQPASDWNIALGVMGASQPEYSGSEENHMRFLPFGKISYKDTVKIQGSEVVRRAFGLGFNVPRLGPWTLGVGTFFQMQGREESDAKALAGMGNRNPASFVGAILGYKKGPFSVSMEIDKGLTSQDGHKPGIIGGIKVGAGIPLPFGGLRVSVQGICGDRDNLAWDFGISQAQAQHRLALVQSGNTYLRFADTKAFSPKSGLRELRFSANYGFSITKKVGAMLMAEHTLIGGDAINSPLVRSKQNTSFMVGVTYQFMGSAPLMGGGRGKH